MKLALEAVPTGVAVIAKCDLKMAGCTATKPAPVTVVNVGSTHDQFVVCRVCLETMIREGEWAVRHARLSPRPDLQVLDKANQAILAIDVKSLPRSRAVDVDRWASGLRRNLAAHSAILNTQFFLMLVLPSTGYLWTDTSTFDSETADYRFELDELVRPDATIPQETGAAAEKWAEGILRSLMKGDMQPEGSWWSESGLKEALIKPGLKLLRLAA